MPTPTDIAAWQQWLGVGIVLITVWGIVREWEVRLVLLTSALALGAIVGLPTVIVREFLATFVNEKFVIPLCCGMGFAHVLRHTGCDQHLVHLLVHPLSKVRWLLVPGTVLVGFLVNMPIVSQSSTAVTIGAVLIPVLRAAQISPRTIGAALLLGCSIGGELLNPAAPELLTTVQRSQEAARDHPELGHDPAVFSSERSVRRIVPLNAIGLAVGTLVFWGLAAYHERGAKAPEAPETEEAARAHAIPKLCSIEGAVYLVKATVPLMPLVFLYLCSYPFNVIEIDPAWLVDPATPANRIREIFPTRLIGFAMVLGVLAAGVVTPTKFKGIGTAFFEGAGFGYANIVSLIVVAQCFGKGIELVGFARTLGSVIEAFPDLLIPLAGGGSLGFAFVCGSGMATAQSLFGFFAAPALLLDVDPTHVGAVVSLAAAAGRTMSPVAAVTLMCARMTGTRPLDLVKMVALPLMISIAFIVVIAMIIAPAV